MSTLAETPGATESPVPLAVANDIANPLAHADQRLPNALKWLRANQPLGFARPDGYDPFWVVSRYADLQSFARRPKLFRSGEQPLSLVDREQEMAIRAATAGDASPYRHLAMMDSPDHTKYRLVTNELFQPKALAATTDRIRAIAREFVDRLAATGGECDFATEIAHKYPLRVVMGFLGVPAEDELHMLRLTQALMGSNEALDHPPADAAHGGAGGLEGVAAGSRVVDAAAQFNAYFDAMMADRRKSPRDDVISVIANARIDGEYMPPREARSYCLVLATAGHDTTAATTAGAVEMLARDPAETAKVRADRSLIPGLVEEATRWVSPAKITLRTVVEDIEFCGRKLEREQRVAMAWISGNRDESVFENPEQFRVDREPNRIISYATGVHGCLGQHLARLEMQIFFEEFFNRVGHFELAGNTRVSASHMVSGPANVPIRFRMQ